MRRGDTVVLCTDGLIDDGGTEIDAGCVALRGGRRLDVGRIAVGRSLTDTSYRVSKVRVTLVRTPRRSSSPSGCFSAAQTQ